MSCKKFLTQNEMEIALEEAINEIEAERNDTFDVVYIPPEDIDVVTDEEDLDFDNNLPEEKREPSDIAGTFELHLPLDNINSADDGYDLSDVETLAEKRIRLNIPTTNNNRVSIPQWVEGQIEYTHSAVCSNTFNVQPINKVKRYNRKEKKDSYVDQPCAITQYNKFMGGVDLHDNGIANYRCSIMGKKWWWPIFSNCLDSTVVNAWKLYNIVNDKKISLLEFKSYIALRLMKSESPIVTRQVPPTAEEIRYDKIGHSIMSSEEKVRRRCRLCHSHSIYMCKRCKVHLHANCFEEYHKKN